MSNIAALFGFRTPVDRRFYLTAGVLLMAVKYVVDALVIWSATGIVWTPLDYLFPLIGTRGGKIAAFPLAISVTLVLWTLPFLWIGASMTLRRAVDANRSPWIVLGFFVPVVNYAVMLLLCFLPSAREPIHQVSKLPAAGTDRFRSALLGVVSSILLGGAGILVTIFIIDSYGVAIFVLIPFALGLVSAYVFNSRGARSSGETLGVAYTALLLLGATLILFALEGVICVAMALPLSVPIVGFGGVLGREIALRFSRSSFGAASCLLLFPAAWTVDAILPRTTVYEVTTAIEIEVPPEEVWNRVVAFDEIHEPPEWFFRLGIARPIRARVEGEGIGAVRYCEFSTGSFVEPITVWDEPYRLAFDVRSQPASLQELSPYRNVKAPHVDDFFRSTRGEFRLVRLKNGNTQLEGTTWYQLNIYPLFYWRPISEWLVSRIHSRVLRQIKREALNGG